MPAVLSLVVPAHDEATVVGRMLEGIVRDDHPGRIEIVVVANGCHDDTARVAQKAAPRATIVEIPTASKTAALNAGDEHATVFPRVYVDADVRITAATLLALAKRLAEGCTKVASPRLEVDTSGSSRWARSFYRVWEHTSYRTRGHIGSGVYAVTEAGRSQFGSFPDVVADDRFVQTQFPLDQRSTFNDLSFTVAAPRTLRAQVRRMVRIQAGNRELERRGLALHRDDVTSTAGELLDRVRRRPHLWGDLPVYVLGYTLSRVRGAWAVRTSSISWNADRTTR